jgi:parallel beta-helix repeat protein
LVNRHGINVPLDAGYAALVNCTDIVASNLTLTSNAEGLLLAYTQNSNVTNNTLLKNYSGIRLKYSLANRISDNNITNNDRGICMFNSSNNTASGNNIAENNLEGLYIEGSSKNRVSGNNITNNSYGMRLSYSSNNLVYHNNFVNNTQQIYDFSWDWPSVLPSTNTWDNGYPSGGNCWNDNAGVDLYGGAHQNETGSDGLSDTPYVIDASNRDSYPLMSLITIFDAGIWNGVPYSVSIISNSTLSNFQLNETKKTISFSVCGSDNTTGFCRITIPNVIVQEMWQGNVTIQIDEQSSLENRTWTEETNTYVFFAYLHPEKEITIIPEFPSALTALMFMTLTILVLIFAKARTQKHACNEK